MSVWRRVLLLLMMLWLPMQSVVAVAMPMCQGRHAPAASVAADAQARHRVAGGAAHEAVYAHGAHHASHEAGADHFAHTSPIDSSTAHAAHGDAPVDSHAKGHGAVTHDCSGCGACHLACAPLLGVRGFDFATGFTAIPIVAVQPLPPLRTLDQPHPPPLG